MVSIYCDGSSSGGSDKPGGWGYVIVRGDDVLAWSFGGDPTTTNNLMEVEAAIQGMRAAIHLGITGRNETIELVSDSQYVIGIGCGIYKPCKNLEVVKKFKGIAAELKVIFRWIKSHTGDKYNEICDKLAKRGKIQVCPILQAKINKKASKKAKKQKRRALIREAAQKIQQA